MKKDDKKKIDKPDAMALLDPEADLDAIGSKMKETVELTSDDFYTVGKNTVPNARALQWMANKKEISTKVIEFGSDNQKAWAHVRGWIGHESHPVIVKEAVVILEYNVIQMSFLLNKHEKKGWILKRNEFGVPETTNESQAKVLHDYMLRKREFGVREAITKAEGIVNKKLLSMEFREKSEIEGEKEEIDAVQQQIKIQKGRMSEATQEGKGGKLVEPPTKEPQKQLPPPKEPEEPKKEEKLEKVKKGKKASKDEDHTAEDYDLMTIKAGKKKAEVYLPKKLEAKEQRDFLLKIANEKQKDVKKRDPIVMKLCDQLLGMLKGKNLFDKKVITDKKIGVIWEMLIENNPNVTITPLKK